MTAWRNREHGTADSRPTGWLMRRRTSAALLLTGIIVGWGLIGEYVRSRDMQRELERLEKRAAEMEDKNRRLVETADGVSSREMLEREARLKMNLQKPGEQVVVINGVDAFIQAELPVGAGLKQSNSERWWRYFFR